VLVIAVVVACGGDRTPGPEADPLAAAPAGGQLPPVPSPVEAARAAVQRACDLADIGACLGAGRPDDACVHGGARGCMAMADREPALASIFRGRACRRGMRSACGADEQPPRITAPGLDRYEHAVADCWVETASVDRDVTTRLTLAITVDHERRTTAIARLGNDDLRRCIERSASRWVVDDNRDINLVIRPPGRDPAYAVLGALTADPNADLGSAIGSLSGGGGGFGSLGGLGSGGGGVGGLGLTRSRVVIDVAQLGGGAAGAGPITRRLRSRYASALRSCHERELASDPDLRTTVVVRFTLTPSGRVDDIAATSAGPDRLRRCIKRRARLWHFDPGVDSARLSATIKLGIR
jgi:hypothetical protein